MQSFLLAAIPFGITMGLFYGIIQGDFVVGIISGLIMGFLFGFLMIAFVYIQSKKFKKSSSTIVEGKNIIMEGAANHLIKNESVGGWLFLTDDEIIFKSHNFNIQRHQTIIPLNRISDVKPHLTLGFVPNGLQIITCNTVEKFVVMNRKAWIQKIKNAISNK